MSQPGTVQVLATKHDYVKAFNSEPDIVDAIVRLSEVINQDFTILVKNRNPCIDMAYVAILKEIQQKFNAARSLDSKIPERAFGWILKAGYPEIYNLVKARNHLQGL